MATRLFPGKVLSANRNHKVVSVRFVPNSASDPATTTIVGNGIASVKHTSTGLWTVNLQDAYVSLLAAIPGLTLASTGKFILQLGVVNVTGTGTGSKAVQIRCLASDTGTLTDLANTAGNSISLRLELKDAA